VLILCDVAPQPTGTPGLNHPVWSGSGLPHRKKLGESEKRKGKEINGISKSEDTEDFETLSFIKFSWISFWARVLSMEGEPF
jgi:hypothetical protein